MTQRELTLLNLGRSVDSLANLDPRGYGVCAVLYEEALRLAGEPLCVHAAKALLARLREGDAAVFITGFVLSPWHKAETDGPVGAAALARTLALARGVKPLFVCPEEAVPAMRALCAVMGLHVRDTLADFAAFPLAAAVVPFTKDAAQAEAEAARLASRLREAGCFPAYCIAVEAPGANARGVYHNAVGADITALEAKSDAFYALLRREGVRALAIGDLGNECGMGALGAHLARYVPRAAEGRCGCPCGGGIAAASGADEALTATVSNWGAYGAAALTAFLAEMPDALYPPELDARAMTRAAECGLVDMYGWQIPRVDGMNLAKNTAIITLMNECVRSALELRELCRPWFEKTLELGFFERQPR